MYDTINFLINNIYINELSTGWFWLILGLAFLLAEVFTPGLFFFVAFACGSFAAAVCGFLDCSFDLQCMVALIVGVITFFMLRRFCATHEYAHGVKTNSDALVGQIGIVVQEIMPDLRGYVRLNNNELWPARGTKNQQIFKDAHVCVMRVEGNHLIVQEKYNIEI